MRSKTLIELLTLSTNLYMISKDEEFMKNLNEMMKKGKKKAEDIIEGFYEGEDEEGADGLLQKLVDKTRQAREDLEKKIEEAAVRVYEKMHIAHTDEIKKLSAEIEKLKRELALTEARIVHLEPRKS